MGRAGLSIAWGFAFLDVPYLTAMIDPGNDASIRLARRLGMAPLRSEVLLGTAVVVFSLHRDDWLNAESGGGLSPARSR